MKVTVCIGSSCHLRGSRLIIEELQRLIAADDIEKEIELSGAFCMKNCVNGVSVTVDDCLFSVLPETAGSFYETEIKAKLQ